MKRCVFCDLIAANPPHVSFLGSCAVFKPLNPVTHGHRLVVPIRHVGDATRNYRLTGEVFAAAAEVLAGTSCDGNLITSVGDYATQTIYHLHVHVIPRREGDGLHLPWTGQVTA